MFTFIWDNYPGNVVIMGFGWLCLFVSFGVYFRALRYNDATLGKSALGEVIGLTLMGLSAVVFAGSIAIPFRNAAGLLGVGYAAVIAVTGAGFACGAVLLVNSRRALRRRLNEIKIPPAKPPSGH